MDDRGIRAAENLIAMQAQQRIEADKYTKHLAGWTYQRLVEYIKEFESDLDEEHEIGARLVSFGSEVQFHIQDIGYYDPDIITFSGVGEKSKKLLLVQNISQLSVLLIAVPKLEEKPRRLGFDLSRKS